jgi:hypothetical protein
MQKEPFREQFIEIEIPQNKNKINKPCLSANDLPQSVKAPNSKKKINK